MGCVSFQVTQALLGDVSLEELKVGHFHRGPLLSDTSLWGTFPCDLSFRIPRILGIL